VAKFACIGEFFKLYLNSFKNEKNSPIHSNLYTEIEHNTNKTSKLEGEEFSTPLARSL
jgi:hypothetical protein